MKSLAKLIAVILIILVLSAFLAPLLYSFLPFKFERIFNRLVMIFTLAAVAVAVYRGVFQFPKESLKWQRESSLALLATAFTAGIFTLFLLTCLKGMFGMVRWSVAEKSLWEWAGGIFMSLFAALLIGVIEETFFRGFMYTTLRRRFAWGLVPGLLATNSFYALIHFVNFKKPFIDSDPAFTDGLRLAAAPFLSLMQWKEFLPATIGLFIFGMILSVLLLRTGSLYPCIGLHAGCVFFLKMDGAFTFHETSYPLIFGSSQGYDGFLGWLFLIIMGACLTFFYTSQHRKTISLILILLTLTPHPFSLYAQSSSWISFDGKEDSDRAKRKNSEAPVLSNSSPLSRASAFEEEHPSSSTVETEKMTAQPVDAGLTEQRSSVSEPREDRDVTGQMPPTSEKTALDKEEIPGNVPAETVLAEIRQTEETDFGAGPLETRDGSAHSGHTDFSTVESGVQTQVRPNPEGDFILSESLSQAEAVDRANGKTISRGVWERDRLLFPGLKDDAAITAASVEAEASAYRGILLSLRPNTVRRIRFREVPPASQLILGYKVLDTEEKAEPHSAIYLKVFAGQHFLKRLRIVSERGWKEEKIKLGAVSFLRRPIPVTFEISTDATADRKLLFEGTIR